MTEENIEITWLGHATTLLEAPDGRNIIIDPWIEDNPGFPGDELPVDHLDCMVLSHGHFDHVGDAPALVEEHQPRVFGIFEVATWLENNGAENVVPMNEGGTFRSDDLNLSLTAVHAQHSSAIMNEDEQLVPGGNPMGWVFEFENDRTIYFSGDTNIFSDMKLISDLYDPDLALLPIGDHFTMGPREAARAMQFLDVDQVIPVHYGTFDVLTGTPEKLRKHLPSDLANIVNPIDPGESALL